MGANIPITGTEAIRRALFFWWSGTYGCGGEYRHRGRGGGGGRGTEISNRKTTHHHQQSHRRPRFGRSALVLLLVVTTANIFLDLQHARLILLFNLVYCTPYSICV